MPPVASEQYTCFLEGHFGWSIQMKSRVVFMHLVVLWFGFYCIISCVLEVPMAISETTP